MATAAASIRGVESNDSAASAAEVKEQLDQLTRDIAELTRVVAAYGNAKVDEASTRAGEIGADMVDRSAAAVAAARESVVSLEQDLENQIRARPLQAIAVAAGVGFIAALLTRR